MKPMLPNVASFLVTEDCNLRCTYCFENHKKKKMTKEVARKGVEFLCENAKENGWNDFSAMLFGGEPWLMPDIVEEILSYGYELAQKNKMHFSASIVTNATLMNDNIKRIYDTYLPKMNFSTQLSVDGIKEVHDKYRITVGGKPTFDNIEKNVPIFQEIYKNKKGSLTIHGCSNPETLPFLFENYKFFREDWGFEPIWFMPIHSETWTKEDVSIYEEQLNKIADYTLDITRRDKNFREVEFYAPIDRCLKPDVFPSAPCGAGKNFVTITAEGDVYPCHHMYFNDPDHLTIIGNIFEGIDEDSRRIYDEYETKDLSCSKLDPDCDAFGCYRCIAENLEQKGSILSVVDCGGNRCMMSKVERKIQLRVREELDKMGLINKTNLEKTERHNFDKGNNPDNPDCLCDARGGELDNSQIRVKDHDCKCGDKDHECKNDKKEVSKAGEETIALALQIVLEKLEKLEAGQNYIVKNLLK